MGTANQSACSGYHTQVPVILGDGRGRACSRGLAHRPESTSFARWAERNMKTQDKDGGVGGGTTGKNLRLNSKLRCTQSLHLYSCKGTDAATACVLWSLPGRLGHPQEEVAEGPTFRGLQGNFQLCSSSSWTEAPGKTQTAGPRISAAGPTPRVLSD